MSMLTEQTKKLRKTADEVKRIKDNNVDWLWRDAITLEDAVKEMRDAANTIENLRNRMTETCHMTLCAVGSDYARYRCSECEQETMAPRVVVEGVSCGYERPSYCVNCGRQVVE